MMIVAEQITLKTLNGNRLSGTFEVRKGTITVTASNGHVIKADIASSLLSTETLAKTLLLQMRSGTHRKSNLF